LNVEAVEKPLFKPQSLPEWREPLRAICHFTVGFVESPYRQRRLSGHASRFMPGQGLPPPFPFQALDLADVFLGQTRFDRQGIVLAVAGEHVNVLVAGHEFSSKRDAPMTLDIPFGSRQDARMNELFLQLRWTSKEKYA
jgi:hypothetical protein